MSKLLVICGPTGTGKTDLGIYLAKKFNGAIISADSRQVYRGLDWGTNKLGKTEAEMRKWRWDRKEEVWVKNGVRVYLYDVVWPSERFSVFDFVERAKRVAEELWVGGRLPIVVGGTGFYIRGLLEGVETGGVEADWKLRRELGRLPLGELQRILKDKDKELFNRLNHSDRNNPRRLVRRIEILQKGRRGVSPIEAGVMKVGLRGEKGKLFGRGDRWVEAVVSGGLVAEVEWAREKGWGNTEPLRSMIYGPVQEFIEGKLEEGEMEAKIRRQVRDYIRRQLVWLAKEQGVEWFDVEMEGWENWVEKRVGEWYSTR